MATKKKYKKMIAARAAEVPQVLAHTTEVHKVLGAELIAQGQTEIDGVAVVPGLYYIQRMPVILEVNHARRMRQIFKRYGNEGLLAYYDAVDRHNEKTPPPRELARELMAQADPGKTVPQ